MEQRLTLHDVPLFAKLSPTEMKLITGISKNKRYRKDQIIFLEGEPFKGFYVLVSGRVKMYRLKGNGEEMVLSNYGPYRSFGESHLFTGSRFYSSCVQAVEESSALFVPSDEFATLLARNPALAVRIAEASALKLMELNRKLQLLDSAVEMRVAKYLLNEIQLNNSIRMPEPYFNLLIHKQDLAAHLGIASATLSRTLRKFKEEGIIREVGRKIFVTEVRKLRGVAGE
jgi:CRP/FNR family transcriptional regulator